MDNPLTNRAGIIIGTAVINHLEKVFGEEIIQDRGSIFSTASKILIRRICPSTTYLPVPMIHAANIVIDQHVRLQTCSKNTFYLFITAEKMISFWLVPYTIIDNAIQQKITKKSNYFAVIIRKGQQYFLGDDNITEFYGCIEQPSDSVISDIEAAQYQIIEGQKFKLVPVN